MMKNAVDFFFLVLLLVCLFVNKGSCIFCTRCAGTLDDVKTMRTCDKDPPTPIPCNQTRDGIYCMAVRIYHNEILQEITKTCTTVDFGSTCKLGENIMGQEINTCIKICQEDGCTGSAITAKLNVLFTLMLSLCSGLLAHGPLHRAAERRC